MSTSPKRMTSRQRALARHALGLPNRDRRAYRNFYVCSPGNPAFSEWTVMVEDGLAFVDMQPRDLPRHHRSELRVFWLTPAAAESVLEAGEHLDPEDFPEPAR